MKIIDSFLNRITMYQLLLYGLLALSFYAVILSIFGLLSFNIISLVASFLTITIVGYGVNFGFSKALKVTPNKESHIITSLILFLILTPTQSPMQLLILAVVAAAAMASKYLLAIRKQHLFNPAAVGLVVGSFLNAGVAWWVGSFWYLIPVLVFGFLILKKIKKFKMFFVFFAASLVTLFLFGFFKTNPVDSLIVLFTSWPLLFLGFVMLTEPSTTPPTLKTQSIYAVIVGFFSGFLMPINGFYITPEIALLIGNVYSYIVRPKYRFELKLSKMNKLSADLYEFVYEKPKNFTFLPGQYMEWTQPHKNVDNRGNRRYFSLASSPTEGNISIAFRQYEKPSSYKKALVDGTTTGNMIAGHLSGEFTLPKNPTHPAVFVAGGIGITPFRSMLKYLVDNNIKSDIVLLYLGKKKEDLVYMDVFEKTKGVGVKVIPSIGGYHITPEDIQKQIPDYKNRVFYISGPQPMVEGFKSMLKKLRVKGIKTDFFPGYTE